MPASGDALVFGASTQTTLNNDLTTGTAWIIPTITFSAAAPAYTISGNSFTLGTAQTFLTGRLSASTNVAGTREGYVEIFSMADIVAPGAAAPANANVGAAITHAATGKPTCSSAGAKDPAGSPSSLPRA